MGESAKPKSVRLTPEQRSQIRKIQESLSPFAECESDAISLAIEYLHADVVRDASAVLQRLHCVTSSYDVVRALRRPTLQELLERVEEWRKRAAQNKQKGVA